MEKSSKIQIGLFLLIFSFFSSTALYSQSKQITLIIDTLSLGQSSNFQVKVSKQGFAGLDENVKSSNFQLSRNQFPNFICQIELRKEDAEILLPLDTKEGKLYLENTFHMKGDTIRISHYSILINCLPKTTETTVHQYKYYYESGKDVELGEPDKTDHDRIVHDQRCQYTPKMQNLTINRKSTNLDLKIIESDGGVSNFHGYKPKSFEKNRETYKGNVTYFHGRTKEINSNYQSNINLKNF